MRFVTYISHPQTGHIADWRETCKIGNKLLVTRVWSNLSVKV